MVIHDHRLPVEYVRAMREMFPEEDLKAFYPPKRPSFPGKEGRFGG